MNTGLGSGFLDRINAAKLVWILALIICAEPVRSAEPNSSSETVSRAASTPAAQTLGSFRLRPGFRIELVASEPMVTAPVALAFDEFGRLFVAEMRDSPAGGQQAAHQSRVRVLDQPNGEGLFQTSTIYAENLAWPSALACYAGGVFVASLPEILFLKDSHGGGGADIRQVVLTGFGGTNAPDAQAFPNNFKWGLDNRIHGVTAGVGGSLTASNWTSGSVSLTNCDFSFDPRSLEVFREAGPAQSGLSFDKRGHRFVSDFTRPLLLPMYEPRYIERNPFYPKPPALFDVAGPAVAVYSLVPPASMTAAASPTANPTNGLRLRWMTAARGSVIYRGAAFPTNYLDNVFIADPEAHAIHRMVLREHGLEFTAERPPDEARSEFLVSSDPAFRPMQVVEGPEGALYIADFQDNPDRGRIYRIVPESFRRPALPPLGKAKLYDLVSTLAKADGWQADTAARLLYERREPGAAALLANMLKNSRLPLARLRALRALDGSEALTEELLLQALRDLDPTVREHAVQLSEKFVRRGAISNALWNQLKALALDPSLEVRYQLAFTVGEIARPDRPLVLAQILGRDANNQWMQNAVQSSLAEGAGSLFAILAGDARFRNDASGRGFLRQLATLIGTKGHLDEVGQTSQFIARGPLEPAQAVDLLQALGEGLRRTRSSLALVDPQKLLLPIYNQAFLQAIDATMPVATRIEAIRLLEVSPSTFYDVGDWLLMLCEPPPAPALQAAALQAVCRYDDAGVLVGVLGRWSVLSPALRTQAVTDLLSRRSRVGAVLDAIQSGRIPLRDLSSTQMNFLRTYSDPAVSQRAIRLLGPVPTRRPQVVEQYQPALKPAGAPEHGRALFQLRCAECHRFGAEGRRFGPNLTGSKLQGRQKLLAAILEPDAAIAPAYTTYVVQTKDGSNLIGLKTDENPTSITLRQADSGEAVWPRWAVETLQPQPWSLMPAGLEQGLSPQDLADLLEYLMRF